MAKGVSQKSTIPALERLKLRLDHDNLELTGYDLEFGIQRSIEVESDCSGEFVILPRLLSEAVRRFSGDVVTMEVDDNYVVKLFCDATEFQISAMSSEEYPALPSLDLAAGMQIEQPVLNSMIRQTSYATSVSEAKPVLTGELFEVEGDTLHVAAIDGYNSYQAARKRRANTGKRRSLAKGSIAYIKGLQRKENINGHGRAIPRLLLREITPTRMATAGATVKTAAAEMVLRMVSCGRPISLARLTARNRKNADCASTNATMMPTSTNRIGAFTLKSITPHLFFRFIALKRFFNFNTLFKK